MPSPIALSRAPQGARNGIPAGEFGGGGGGGGALTRRWPEHRTKTISPPPPPLNSQREATHYYAGDPEGGERRSNSTKSVGICGRTTLFSGVEQVVKKVCPSKLGTLKMDTPFQCLFIECILPSFLGNNFHSSCSLSLAARSTPSAR